MDKMNLHWNGLSILKSVLLSVHIVHPIVWYKSTKMYFSYVGPFIEFADIIQNNIRDNLDQENQKLPSMLPASLQVLLILLQCKVLTKKLDGKHIKNETLFTNFYHFT